MHPFPIESIRADFCVVGGGLAGLCAAIAAARHGARTVLMQERPMLGGNASSEIRMWVCGAQAPFCRETGLIEELLLENYFRNPGKNYSVWDSVLLGAAWAEPNLTLLLNCSCFDGETDDGRLLSVTGWQTTTQRFVRVQADLFADCSGDSVLAPIAGAETRTGREGRNETGEPIAPPIADRRTMGMSCLLQARECADEQPFTPPDWAEKLTAADFAHRLPHLRSDAENFWYLELGGEDDCIADTERVRDALLRLAYGVWDFLKNDPSQRDKHRNFALDWVGVLPGKRESRRYVGDYVLTQQDVEAGGRFDDLVAYGGWPMDDHDPAGFRTAAPPNRNWPVPDTYGIPYRCLYARNVANLFCAGRNISVTHAAMSSTRVMATCALLGQAVGTAAALAAQLRTTPRGVYERHLAALQRALLDDDCWLPGLVRPVSPLTRAAALASDMRCAERLRSGVDRDLPGEEHAAYGPPGCSAVYRFAAPAEVALVRLTLDSDLNRLTLPAREAALNRPMWHNALPGRAPSHPPQTLLRDLDLVCVRPDGTERVIEVRDNRKRLVRLPVGERLTAVRLVLRRTWGAAQCNVFAFEAV